MWSQYCRIVLYSYIATVSSLIQISAEDHDVDMSPVIVVHGGAGSIPPDQFDAKVLDTDVNITMLLVTQYEGMKEAVRAGYKILNDSGSVLDALEAAVHVMEDNEAFNAGRGSKLNIFGHVEMDASIMSGQYRGIMISIMVSIMASIMSGDDALVGAVASVSGVRHPVSLARHVMENTSHVLVVGEVRK